MTATAIKSDEAGARKARKTGPPISAAKLGANRANALRSTGPRTAASKARSARNGLRHGLLANTLFDRSNLAAVEQLGRAFAAGATGPEEEIAYQAAAAEIMVLRARAARRRLSPS